MKARPNVRMNWQTCFHCLAGWYGPERSPCPDCGAVAGTLPWRARRLELVAVAIVAVCVLVAAGFLLALWALR